LRFDICDWLLLVIGQLPFFISAPSTSRGASFEMNKMTITAK